MDLAGIDTSRRASGAEKRPESCRVLRYRLNGGSALNNGAVVVERVFVTERMDSMDSDR
jgi:hypothetical protein